MVPVRRSCLGCNERVSPRTILRHLKNGCDPRTTRNSRLRRAVMAALARVREQGLDRLPPAPRPPRPSRHYHRRPPPQGPPPPALRDRLALPTHEEVFDFPMGSPEAEHPDFQFDTPGAGPGPSARATSPRFIPPQPIDEDDEYAQITLQDVFPWIENLNAEDYLAHEFLSQLVRTGGTHILSPSSMQMLIRL